MVGEEWARDSALASPVLQVEEVSLSPKVRPRSGDGRLRLGGERSQERRCPQPRTVSLADFPWADCGLADNAAALILSRA